MTSTLARLPLPSLTAAIALALAPATAQSLVTQFGESVLASGDPAPGFPAGATVAVGFTSLGAAMDRNGTLLFRARINQNSALGIDNTNDGGLYLGRSYGDLQLVLRTGTQAPGCAPGTLLRNNTTTPSNGLGTNPRLSPVGSVLFFRSALFDPVTPANTPNNANTALFWGQPNAIQLLAREGDLVPFLGNGERYGEIVFSHQGDAISATGTVVFAHSLVTGGSVNSGNDSLLAFGVPGSLQLIAREGSAWSGSANGELLGPVAAFAQLNEAGAVLHEVQFTLGTGTVPVTAADNRALALWLGGVDVALLREGDQAPGLPTGVRFTDESTTLSFVRFSNCALNASGTTAVRVYLAGGGTAVGVDDTAVYLAAPSGATKVFRRGEAAPTLPAGITFGDVTADSLGLDDQGRIVCTTSLQGAVTANDDSAVWFGAANNLRVLAREGDLAPGLLPSGNGPWRFGELFGNVRPAINGNGAVVMPAVVGDGVATRVAWFSFLPDGRNQVLLDGAESWTTPLGSSPIATTQFISPAGGGDSSPAWFNNQGDFTFVATMQVTTVNPGTAIVRARLGSLQATPAAIPATGGVQSWNLDAGPGQAFGLYVVLGTQSDTRPGLPFGGSVIPLNPDPWFSLTLSAANSAVYSSSLGLLDGQGRASAAFVFPPGFAAFAGSTFHHAFVVLDANLQLPFVSEPSGLKLF